MPQSVRPWIPIVAGALLLGLGGCSASREGASASVQQPGGGAVAPVGQEAARQPATVGVATRADASADVGSAAGPVATTVADASPGRAPTAGSASATGESAADAASPWRAEIATCRAFLAWAERYRRAGAAQRKAVEGEGATLAGERRAALATLIRHDPRTALEVKLPLRDRAVMPPAIAAQLETRFSDEGRFVTLARVPSETPDGGDARPTVPMLLLRDGEYESSTYGRRLDAAASGPGPIAPVPVHGIVLDGVAAVHEDAVRSLEEGEQPDRTVAPFNADFACPVSGRDAAAGAVAEVAGRPVFLCSGGHIEVLNDDLADAEAAARAAVAKSAWTEGTRTVLYIRARYTDQTDADLPSVATCEKTMADCNAFLNQCSYGKLTLVTTVVPVVVALNGAKASYTSTFTIRSEALAAAKAAGYDPANYHLDAVRYSGGTGSFSGQAYVGARGVWMKTDNEGVAAHEFGHNLGLLHANSWTAATASPIGPGSSEEYGNSFDRMGNSGPTANHFNAGSKQYLGWLPADHVHLAKGRSGTFRVFPQDDAALLPAAQKQSLRVVRDATRHYLVEFRRRHTGNAWLMNGATVKWHPASGSNLDLLLDHTPGSPDGKKDNALVIGRTFSDRAARIHITPIGFGGTTPQSLDVVVNHGAFPGNRAPTATVTGPTTTPTATAIALSATASDADGDALSYAWDFGDRTFSTTNSASVGKSWSTAGRYVVRCTVSDMKGGLASDSLVVTVGTVSTFVISGRVLDGAAGVEGVRIHNGQTGNAYRGTFTDSDGGYQLANLAAGSVTLAAVSPLHAVTPSFANPVTVGPDANGRDFTAVRLNEITVTATDAAAEETGGDTGSWRIARSGPTAAARTVAFTLSGTAVRPGPTGADYALSVGGTAVPITGSAGSVTIPAGQAAVDVLLTATADTATEAGESAILTWARARPMAWPIPSARRYSSAPAAARPTTTSPTASPSPAAAVRSPRPDPTSSPPGRQASPPTPAAPAAHRCGGRGRPRPMGRAPSA